MTESFLQKAKSEANTSPLSQTGTKIFLAAVMLETKSQTEPIPTLSEVEHTFTMKVILKRIESLQLPISFSTTGLIAMEGLAEGNPGRAVTLLIDCLTAYEGKEVSAYDISKLYPWGFYNEAVFEDYVDNYLKPRKVKWSEIY